MNEAAAIKRLRRGDIRGLEALVRCYQTEAIRVAYLVTYDRAAAEDVAQSAFLSLLNSIDTFDAGRPFAPWFMRIVVNRALKMVQADQRMVDLEEGFEESIPDPLPGPELALSMAEMEDRLRGMLGTLSPEQRAVIVMHYYLGFTETEMAARLGRPIGTVRWRLHAARQQLRRLFAASEPSLTEGD